MAARRPSSKEDAEKVLAALRYPAPLASPGFAFRGEPAQRDKAPGELYLIPLRPWPFSARKAKSAVFALLHFSNTSVLEKCAVPPCTALPGC